MADLITPMAIRVAATLHVADHIAAGRSTAVEIAAATGTDPDTLDRVLRHLAHAGVVRRDDSGRYALTALGDTLREDDPSELGARFDVEGPLGRADLSFVQLLHSVRTGEAAFPEQFGRSFWDDLSADEARSASYAELMGTDVATWALEIVPAYDWGSLGHIVDVGGGKGTLLIALLRAFPELRGTVLDLPGPAGTARAALAEAGLSERADAIAGSFFDPLPAGAGGYLLSAIVHNWNDDGARAILRRCAEAAGAAGKVFTVEKTGAGGESPSTSMDLRVLAYLGGRERGVSELTTLAESSGLRTAAVHLQGDLSIIELTA
jgi:hypothetical protein